MVACLDEPRVEALRLTRGRALLVLALEGGGVKVYLHQKMGEGVRLELALFVEVGRVGGGSEEERGYAFV